jgi:hypothetical protein
MSYIIAALIAILVFSGGLSKMMGAPPKWFSKTIQQFLGFCLTLFTLVLLVKGRYEMAVPVGIAAIILLGSFDKLKAYFNGGQPTGGENHQTNAHTGRNIAQNELAMSKEEAYQVLGLSAGAGIDDIRSAHRTLITKIHPDTGGSTYLAARVNLARDVLLKMLNHR